MANEIKTISVVGAQNYVDITPTNSNNKFINRIEPVDAEIGHEIFLHAKSGMNLNLGNIAILHKNLGFNTSTGTIGSTADPNNNTGGNILVAHGWRSSVKVPISHPLQSRYNGRFDIHTNNLEQSPDLSTPAGWDVDEGQMADDRGIVYLSYGNSVEGYVANECTIRTARLIWNGTFWLLQEFNVYLSYGF